MRMSLENPLLYFHKHEHQISVQWDFSVCPDNAMQNPYRDNFWRRENYSNKYKTYLLLLLRNATKHNSIKFSAAWLHVSSDKFWNCLKDLKCNNVKNSCLLVNKRTLRSTKLKKNILSLLKNVKNSERNVRNRLIFYDARNAWHISDTGTSSCISFFSTTLLL